MISHKNDGRYIPYSDWFDVEKLKSYHRVIELEQFMKHIAPLVWKPAERRVYCHALESQDDGSHLKDCKARDGFPFKAFWDSYEVSFVSSETYEDFSHYSPAHFWQSAFPAHQHKVLAFKAAPAQYPVSKDHAVLQKFVELNTELQRRVSNFIDNRLVRPYLGVHIPNDDSWDRTCDHIPSEGMSFDFLASPQCFGYNSGKQLMRDMCKPPGERIVADILLALSQISASSIFLSVDHQSQQITEVISAIKSNNPEINVVVAVPYNKELALDLGIHIEADHFVGNCMSAISHFVTRKRKLQRKSVSFLGVEVDYTSKTEL